MTHPSDMAVLVERLRALEEARTAFVRARTAMNAARPDFLHGTKAERDLYDERYRADHAAERELFRAALDFASDAEKHNWSNLISSTDQRTGQEVAPIPSPGEFEGLSLSRVAEICAEYPEEIIRVRAGLIAGFLDALTQSAPPVEAECLPACVNLLPHDCTMRKAALQQSRYTPGEGVSGVFSVPSDVAARQLMGLYYELSGNHDMAADVRSDDWKKGSGFGPGSERALLGVMAAMVDAVRKEALAASPVPVDASGALQRAIETLAASRHLIGKYVPDHHWLPEHDARIAELKAALHAAPAAEPDHIGGVWMPGPDEAPAAGEKRDAD